MIIDGLFESWVGKFPWRRDRLPIPLHLGFPGGWDGKASAFNARDLGLIPGLGRSPEGNVNPLQYSCLENPPGQRSLVGYSPWGCKEWDMTQWLNIHTHRNYDNNTHLRMWINGSSYILWWGWKTVSKTLVNNMAIPTIDENEHTWWPRNFSCDYKLEHQT